MSVLQSLSRKLRSWPKPGNSSQRVIALIFSILQDFIRVNMNTKTSDLLLDMCTHVTTLLLWMVCAAHLVYPSLQSVHQQSIRYWGTVVSGIVGHRAVTNLKVPNFCMICMIAFTRICVLTLFQVAHSYPLTKRSLKSNSQVCACTHYSHLTVPVATQMYLLGKDLPMGGSVQLTYEQLRSSQTLGQNTLL